MQQQSNQLLSQQIQVPSEQQCQQQQQQQQMMNPSGDSDSFYIHGPTSMNYEGPNTFMLKNI